MTEQLREREKVDRAGEKGVRERVGDRAKLRE
jgi:hypothetical protein